MVYWESRHRGYFRAMSFSLSQLLSLSQPRARHSASVILPCFLDHANIASLLNHPSPKSSNFWTQKPEPGVYFCLPTWGINCNTKPLSLSLSVLLLSFWEVGCRTEEKSGENHWWISHKYSPATHAEGYREAQKKEWAHPIGKSIKLVMQRAVFLHYWGHRLQNPTDLASVWGLYLLLCDLEQVASSPPTSMASSVNGEKQICCGIS